MRARREGRGWWRCRCDRDGRQWRKGPVPAGSLGPFSVGHSTKKTKVQPMEIINEKV